VNRHGRRPQVVDTNAAVVANGRQGESYICASKCAQALLSIKQSGVIVIDDSDLILKEYRDNCSPYEQHGVGHAFVKWIHDNLYRADLVQRVALTPRLDPQRHFEEVPEHKDLTTFDPSDQKFVAVANTHRGKPTILQALDSKWWGWKDALLECGITVEFPCPDEIQVIYDRKMR
jgi:hypothetical protein